MANSAKIVVGNQNATASAPTVTANNKQYRQQHSLLLLLFTLLQLCLALLVASSCLTLPAAANAKHLDGLHHFHAHHEHQQQLQQQQQQEQLQITRGAITTSAACRASSRWGLGGGGGGGGGGGRGSSGAGRRSDGGGAGDVGAYNGGSNRTNIIGRNGSTPCNVTANTLMSTAGGSVRCARYLKRPNNTTGDKMQRGEEVGVGGGGGDGGMQVTMAANKYNNQKNLDIYYYERDEYEDETVIIDTIAVTATTTAQLMESGCGSIGANCQKCRNIKILLRLSLRYFYDINCEIVKNTI
uniref:Uncharacterized protein n=1 Tax=Ceratitis capitata TaxID=7213 RepID=W8BC45_CERCA